MILILLTVVREQLHFKLFENLTLGCCCTIALDGNTYFCEDSAISNRIRSSVSWPKKKKNLDKKLTKIWFLY